MATPDSVVWDTGQLAAMRALEIRWEWFEGKQRDSYIPKDEAAAIADYCKQFGKFPPAGLDRHKKRYIRNKFGLPNDIK